ncbi:hypothetical protein ABQF04_17635 [Xanthomonas campestris pv. campestris]|uniref:hypothetical protein n=1 Tax=Xanthomonas campestris TaxID=339 RepID=UPI0032E475D4
MDFTALRALTAPGILRSSGASRTEFKSWLAQGDYRIEEIEASGDMRLHVTNSKSLVESLGYDHSRFACAAFESVRQILADPDFPRATAWAAIRMYYAAFFAAHSLMRAFGISCSQVDPEQASLVTSYATIYGIENRFGRGFYSAVWMSGDQSVTIKKLGESHKDTWKEFSSWLRVAEDRVSELPILSSVKIEIIDFISSLRSGLGGSGSAAGNWLSTFRNNVNYRHSYDAWFPYRKSSVRFDQVSRYVDGWHRPDFSPNIAFLEVDERTRFFGLCAAMLYFLRGVAQDVIENSDKSSIHNLQTARLIAF